jgi:hypothetical protein
VFASSCGKFGLLLGAFLVAFPVVGQSTSPADVAPGTGEVTGFGGVVAGVGTHGVVGGGIHVTATKSLLIGGEFSYIPLGGGSGEILGTRYRANAKAYDFNGGAQYSFATSNPKVAPYVSGGLGIIHGSGSVAGPGFSASAGSNDFMFHFGGGLRYFVKDNWGIRPELKVFAGSDTYVRLAIGLFYRFK